jgi:hypothetical protein
MRFKLTNSIQGIRKGSGGRWRRTNQPCREHKSICKNIWFRKTFSRSKLISETGMNRMFSRLKNHCKIRKLQCVRSLMRTDYLKTSFCDLEHPGPSIYYSNFYNAPNHMNTVLIHSGYNKQQNPVNYLNFSDCH